MTTQRRGKRVPVVTEQELAILEAEILPTLPANPQPVRASASPWWDQTPESELIEIREPDGRSRRVLTWWVSSEDCRDRTTDQRRAQVAAAGLDLPVYEAALAAAEHLTARPELLLALAHRSERRVRELAGWLTNAELTELVGRLSLLEMRLAPIERRTNWWAMRQWFGAFAALAFAGILAWALTQQLKGKAPIEAKARPPTWSGLQKEIVQTLELTATPVAPRVVLSMLARIEGRLRATLRELKPFDVERLVDELRSVDTRLQQLKKAYAA